jgi:predicted RNA-binding Zn-ribbon protein involved in translation (DUF1610 family)
VLRRWFTILAHKYDWHYAPVYGPFKDGHYQRWCKWCGLRDSYPYHPKRLIPVPSQPEGHAVDYYCPRCGKLIETHFDGTVVAGAFVCPCGAQMTLREETKDRMKRSTETKPEGLS